MDVDTGRLLAMVSKPGFDPNEMSGHLTPEAEQRLLADRYQPLHDKTVGETYYPGLDVQGGVGDRGAGGSADHAGGEDQVPRLVRAGAPRASSARRRT